MVASGGIEPPTQGFSVPCSTDWAMKPKIKWRSRRGSNSRSSAWQADVITTTPRDQLVAGEGFEPTTFGLWARRATKLLHPAILIIQVAEKEGFEPPRRFRPPGFQDRSLQPDLGISPHFLRTNKLYHNLKNKVKYFYSINYIHYFLIYIQYIFV